MLCGARLTNRLFQDERGASSVEYAVLAALIIAVCVIAIAALGNRTHGLFAFFDTVF